MAKIGLLVLVLLRRLLLKRKSGLPVLFQLYPTADPM